MFKSTIKLSQKLSTFQMATSQSDRDSFNVLIAVCGSVAAIKLPLLVDEIKNLELGSHQVSIKVITTEKAKNFYSLEEVRSKGIEVLGDEVEWSSWSKMGDPVLHIELRRWADVLLIAPLDANTLAKMATGMCDNLVTCVTRAWDLNKSLIFCPAMNTAMWNHPVTNENIAKLESWGYIHVQPIAKRLACGDTGCGAMQEVKEIAKIVRETLLKCLKVP